MYRLARVFAISVGIVSAVHISACGTSSSEVSQLGPDTYNIVTSAPPLRGGSVEAKTAALSGASALCARSGKEAFVTTIKTSKNHAEVSFRCE